MSFFEVLVAYQGVIGTLLGVAMAFAYQVAGKLGEIRYYFDNVHINYYRLDLGNM